MGSLRRALVAFACALGCFCLAAPASAEREVVSLTFSPLHLLFPIFEAQAEVRLVPAVGLALIGGIGSMKADVPVSCGAGVVAGTCSHSVRFGVTEVGGQVAVYPLADFRSLQLGAELMWLHVNGEVEDVTGAATGLAAGPFVGYKLLARQGFTFFAQGGFQYVFAHAEASNTSGESASASRSQFIPLLNLNIGWSF